MPTVGRTRSKIHRFQAGHIEPWLALTLGVVLGVVLEVVMGAVAVWPPKLPVVCWDGGLIRPLLFGVLVPELFPCGGEFAILGTVGVVPTFWVLMPFVCAEQECDGCPAEVVCPLVAEGHSG